MGRWQYCIKLPTLFNHQGIWSNIFHDIGSDLTGVGNTRTLLLNIKREWLVEKPTGYSSLYLIYNNYDIVISFRILPGYKIIWHCVLWREHWVPDYKTMKKNYCPDEILTYKISGNIYAQGNCRLPSEKVL